MTRQAVALLIGLVVAIPVLATVTAPPAAAAPDDGVLRVLLFYKDNFHASHVQARQAVRDLTGELGTQYGQTVEIQETQDAGAFTTANLANKDAVVFAQTGGVLFNEAQRAALEAYIRGGGGYAGIHYAGWSAGTVSEHDVNPFYLRLVGAVSEGHPENPAQRPGTVSVTDAAHPLTQGLPATFSRTDEWYDWNVNPAQNVRTLLTVDESSYGSAGKQGTMHPVTWCQTIDSGRSWYTGMGHETTHYSEPVMRQMIKHGLAYSSGLVTADCSPPAKDEQGSWSGVTPWPLMPINAALTQDGKVQSFGSVSSGCTDTTPYDWSGNSCVFQGGQTEFDVWDPAVPRTMANLRDGLSPNTTYTDLFCSMQVQNPNGRSIMTVGGDDGLGGNAPNDAAIGVTSYSQRQGIRNEAPMNIPRWYPTGSTMPNGDVVVQGGSRSGGPGGPGVLTPEIHTPNAGTGWKLLNGATSALAYGDGGGGNGPDENRWWYPRAFVTPGSGKLFNISGTQMFDLDPYAGGGEGAITPRGTLGSGTPGNQGALGNPVGATSTAVMYEPGKILQVGGGHWVNGGGPDGARAGMTVDITGAGAPVVEATAPMRYQRHWATSTVLPDGQVLVTGGSRANADNGGYVTNAEMWNPDTGQWTTVEVPYEHARLYHSIALLLPDGRVMIGGGGAPGPRNYTDVEYYSPSYLFDGQQPAARPTITSAPRKVGYDGTFQAQVSGTIGRVTLVRNGSVTHGFNNDQNFQELAFTQSGGTLSIETPQDGTYAPPGAYMLFAWNTDGTPSVAKIVEIDPAVKQNSLTPVLVDQFEYPRLPVNWLAGQAPALHTVTPGTDGAGRMSPWTVDREVQLVRSTGANQQGGLGIVGYHLGLRNNGSLSRPITGLDAGRSYRVSLKYARDSRTAGTADGTATISVADLDETLTATTANPSQGNGANTFKSFVGTFTATGRSQTLSLSAEGAGNAGLMIDDLVVTAAEPGLADAPIHYAFEEGSGTSAANTGTDSGVGPAVLTGTTGWSPNGVFGGALDMPGGSNANAVDLPDNLLRDATSFTTSFWVRPDTKGNWINLLHIGDGTGDGTGASFFQIQMQTQAAGNTGLAVTFKAKGTSGTGSQQRLYATPTRDVAANAWNHVVFTRTGSTGTLFLNGEQIAQRNDFSITMAGVGSTTNNWIGRNGFPDPAFDGLVDEVRMYTSSLSPTDVAALYADGSAKRTTTTVSVTPASPTPFGETLTVATTVKDEAGANASGQVELWLDGAKLGDSVALANGTASFPALPTNLAPGDHTVEVRFVPAAGFRASTQSVTHTVTRPPVGEGIPAHYTFDEGTGTTAANSGTDPSIGSATLGGSVGWTANGKFGAAADLPGGASGTGNQVNLPNNIEAGMDDEFTVSLWTRPRALPNWVPLLQLGSSTDTFFLLQSSTQAQGPTGFAATFKAPGNANQERLTLGNGNDLPLNAWTHVVFTMKGSVGKIYWNGELKGTRNDFTIGLGDVGVNGNTTANMLGGTSWPDPRWNGAIDDFRLYGYELTAAEVGNLYAGPNTAPVAVDDAFATDAGEALTVAAPGVLANDTDAEGQTLTATVVTQPTNGTVTLAPNGGFTYTPAAGFVGTDTFTYRARDGFADSAPATVTITVNEVTAAPVAVDDAYETDEDVVLEVEAPGVLDNDTDGNGDDLTAGGLTQPANGEVALDADGSFTYTPDADFFGTDTFTYTASDGDLVSDPATVTITVNEVNTAPTAADRAYETDEGTPLVVAAPGVLTEATDAEGDTLRAAVAEGPSDGELILGADGAFAYVPAEGFSGTDTFTFTASDGRLSSAPATVTITVTETEEPGPVKSESAIMGSAPAMVYGRTAVVTARVIPSAATGAVEVRDGERVVASGTVTDGTARITLPAGSLQPGVRNLTLAYVGDAAHTASSDALQVRVAKATPSLKVTAPKQAKKGKRAKVTVTLSAPGGVPVTGRVTVQVQGATKVSAVVRNGRVTVSVPVGQKLGQRKVTVTYGGSALATRATKAVKIRVKR